MPHTTKLAGHSAEILEASVLPPAGFRFNYSLEKGCCVDIWGVQCSSFIQTRLSHCWYKPLLRLSVHHGIHIWMRIMLALFTLAFAFEAPAAEALKVIIFPLQNQTKFSSLTWLSEGIAMSISEQIQSRSVRVVERKERTDFVESVDLPPGAQISRASMIRVAQKAAADLIVMGEFSGTEQNLRIAIRALDMRAMKLSGDMVANGQLEELPQVENTLAWLLLSNMNLEKTLARERFQERMRKVPNRPFALFIQSLDKANENERIKILLKTVGLYHDFPEAQFQLGSLYFRKGDCGNAMPHLMLGRREESTHLENDFMSGTCYLQGSQPTQAVQSYSRLLAYSRPFEVLNNIAVAYLRKGDYVLSLSSLIEARNQARADPTVALNLAIVRHLQGNNSAARNTLEEALKSGPRNGMLHFVHGLVLKVLGENDKALDEANKARSLGINVEKLQTEDPKSWARIFTSWEASRGISSLRTGGAGDAGN
jgi:Flp pilus assembly protein TadD